MRPPRAAAHFARLNITDRRPARARWRRIFTVLSARRPRDFGFAETIRDAAVVIRRADRRERVSMTIKLSSRAIAPSASTQKGN
ncbi:MAG TPA: hypothetical protein VF529_13245 [Solirubrobacteraceae bacterium]